LVVAVAGAVAVLYGADAQAQASGAQPADATLPPPATSAIADKATGTLDTITVTGTNIPSDSTAYASSPITVISSQALLESGSSNIEDYFQTQPDFVLSGQSSYSNQGPSGGDNARSIGGSQLNLRGIGPQYTLVLLNGRRFQGEDPANIDLIPLDAIDRIEILKSGASAIYGSDAVAGVVNIITKRSSDGLTLNATYGESGEGDDGTTRASVTWGTSNDRLNVFTAFEYYQRDGLTQGQRTLSADPDLSRFNSNFPYFPPSYSSLAQMYSPNGSGPLALNQSKFGCGSYSRNPADFVPVNPQLYATACDARVDEDNRSLVNPQQRGNFLGSLDYKLSDNMTFYSDLVVARTLTKSVALDFGADGFGDPACTGAACPLSPIPANNYWNPFGAPITDVSYGFPEAGNQTDQIDNTAVDINLGLKGIVGRINYDVGGSFYSVNGNFEMSNLATNAGLYAAETRPGAAAINLFCNDCNTPAQLAGVFGGASILSESRMGLIHATASAPVASLPSGDINIAIGSEFQRDTLSVQPDVCLLHDCLNDFQEYPESVGRNYTSAYVEAQLPIFGKDFTAPGAASLAFDVAARFENIEKVGSSTNPTVSMRWEPIANNLAFRASYGTSFRAPSLDDEYAAQNNYVTSLIGPKGTPVDYQVVVGGNPNLKPETATYTTYGVVFTPEAIAGLTAIIDHWRLVQKNIVIQTSAQLILEGIEPGTMFTAANGEPGIDAEYENAAGQIVQGTDFDIDYRHSTDNLGLFDVHLTGTRLDYFEVNDSSGAGFVNYAGGTALASSLPSVTGMPKLRATLAANWTHRALSATYMAHYTGSYIDPTIPGGVTVNSYTTHDVRVAYDFGKSANAESWLSRVTLAAGVNDLTNTAVPIFYAGPLGGGLDANGYDTSIVDPVGRFIYTSVRVKFGSRGH
jgi:iron complex outermembrane receptor protein